MLNETHRAQHATRVSFEREFGSSIDPNMYEDMNALEKEYTGTVISSHFGIAVMAFHICAVGQTSTKRDPSPPFEELDDALIQEYLEELEDEERREARQSKMAVSPDAIDIDTEDPNDLERASAPTSTYSHILPPLKMSVTAHFPGDYLECSSPSRSVLSDFQMSSPSCSPSRAGAATSPLKLDATWNCPFCSTLTSRSHIACTACATKHTLDHARLVWFDADSHPGVQGR